MSKPRFLITAIALMVLIALVLPAPGAPGGGPLVDPGKGGGTAAAPHVDPALVDPAKDRMAFDAAAERAAPGAGNSYAWARCAGLFRSVKLHAGREALGAARWGYASRAEAALLDRAARVRGRAEGQAAASARMGAEMDAMALARVYLDRYAARAAATGRPWSDDPVWAQDTAACRRLLAGG